MSSVRRFDHVGITVADLDGVTAFFVGLALSRGQDIHRGRVPGHGLRYSRLADRDRDAATPDGGTWLELSSFVRPDHLPGSPAAPANELGLRNVSFEVQDLHAAVDWAAADGYRLVGGIGEYEGS